MLRHLPGGPVLCALWSAPWDVLLRPGVKAPRLLTPGSVSEGLVLPEIATGDRGGVTWLPAVGRVAWTVPARWSLDPRTGHDFSTLTGTFGTSPRAAQGSELLRCWSRARLTEAWHAALVAARTDDAEETAATFAGTLVRSFQDHNPPGSSPHWLSPMEVALRAVRLLHAAAALGVAARARPARAELRAAQGEALRALAVHEAWLDARSDWRGPYTGNHQLVTAGARALLACRLAGRQGTRQRALTTFWRELRRQVLEDGLHFESSTGYHLLAAETAAHVALAAGDLVPAAGRRRLGALLEATDILMRPDGTVALVGDADGTRFLDWPPSAEPPREGEARPIVSLLERAQSAPGKPRSGRPRLVPTALVEGGLVVLATAGGTRPLHATVSVTLAGRDGTGGHAHDDAGAYEFWAGERVVSFRGTRCYFEDTGLRAAFRGVSAASLLQVDGMDQNAARAGTPFRRRERAKPMLVAFSDEGAGRASIGHHGFTRAAGRPLVLRHLALDAAGVLQVADEVTGAGERHLALRVHWAPGAVVEARTDGAVVRLQGGALVRLGVEFRDASGRVLPVGVTQETVRHSARFGEDEEAQATVVRARARLPVRVIHSVRVT